MWAPDRHQASPRTVQDHLLKTDQQKTLFIQDYNWSQTLILTRTNHTDVANVQNQTKRSSSFSRLPFGAPSNETGFNSLYSPLPFSLDIYLMESHEERHGCCFKVCVFLQIKKVPAAFSNFSAIETQTFRVSRHIWSRICFIPKLEGMFQFVLCLDKISVDTQQIFTLLFFF